MIEMKIRVYPMMLIYLNLKFSDWGINLEHGSRVATISLFLTTPIIRLTSGPSLDISNPCSYH